MNRAEDVTRWMQQRRSCKAFDPQRTLSDEQVLAVRTALRMSPSSINGQPWHFILASSLEGKGRIADVLTGTYAHNSAKVRHCALAVVFCAKNDIHSEHIEALLKQESQDGRLTTDAARQSQRHTRHFYVSRHRQELKDLRAWVDRQCYIALGTLLTSAAAMGVDACPIEGFEPAAVDQALGLSEQGLHPVVMVALGFRSDEDWNHRMPKSRLPEADILSEI